MSVPGCELCVGAGGTLVWSDTDWRVIRVADDAFPAFYRVVCQRHVREFTDLEAGARSRCMALVAAVEQALRDALTPTKINLASLGNMTPHLHWHVIARFDWDGHFPQPVWGAAQRSVQPPAAERLALPLTQLDAHVAQAVAAVH
jgi:diadenosine tetraphosphate (Ap4A) HIT family hydrolase